MPLRRTEATVLRSYRVGEADKLVVFFTRELGKLRGMAKGARRPRSRFGSSLEVGTEIELTFFEKEGRELVSVDRCDIIRSDFALLGDPVIACTLAYLADLVDAFAPEREPNAKLYRLFSAARGGLVGGMDPAVTACYFEAWLLRLGGLYPRRETCAACGEELVRKGARYLAGEHRLLCARCARGGMPLSPEALDYLRLIWETPPKTLPPPAHDRALEELTELQHRLIGEQLDKELSSRQILSDLLRRERQR